MNKYLRFYETIPDEVTGIILMKGKKYQVIDENIDTYFIDYDKNSQKNMKNNVKFNKYGFEKLLQGNIYDVIEEN